MCDTVKVVDGPGAFCFAMFSMNCLNAEVMVFLVSILMWLTIIIYDPEIVWKVCGVFDGVLVGL